MHKLGLTVLYFFSLNGSVEVCMITRVTWSLGLVILECAIGRFPYVPSKGEGWLSFYELLEAIVDQPPPSATADQFSAEFCSFISSW
jgi:hypothetical protein